MPDRGALYEYSIYASIILLSGMGVAALPSYLDAEPISPVNAYTAAMYLSFLGWAFQELHTLHSKRSPERAPAGPSLVVDNSVTGERLSHSTDPQQSWMRKLSFLQCIAVRGFVALGAKISPIHPAIEEVRISAEVKEKPEAA